ncbi:hypothetical protein BH24BAC1_BH24BAC1_13960 [soil metagenome]|jgi:methylmalonyl-CoA mutase
MFRAFRLVWAAVLKAYGAESMAGLLRVHTTTEAMATLIGGCDSLSVEPFDSTFQSSGPFSERLARNIPLILKEEAYLDKIVDPAAGSFYLETLTDLLARQAWALFQEVETRGGFIEPAALEFIQGEINRVSRVKYSHIASGKEVIVGTNRFPNLQEELPFDPEQLIQSKEFDTSRGPYSFEVMRMAAELHHRKKRSRPIAAIAVLGDAIERHVNASFAREFFSCANFDTQVLSFETVPATATALLSLPAKVIVLSASSSEFAQFGKQFGPLLKNHPQRPALILASDPTVMKEEMIASGFNEFMFEGCDTKEIIARIQEKLMKEEE